MENVEEREGVLREEERIGGEVLTGGLWNSWQGEDTLCDDVIVLVEEMLPVVVVERDEGRDVDCCCLRNNNMSTEDGDTGCCEVSFDLVFESFLETCETAVMAAVLSGTLSLDNDISEESEVILDCKDGVKEGVIVVERRGVTLLSVLAVLSVGFFDCTTLLFEREEEVELRSGWIFVEDILIAVLLLFAVMSFVVASCCSFCSLTTQDDEDDGEVETEVETPATQVEVDEDCLEDDDEKE